MPQLADTTPAIVLDHPFIPKDLTLWFGLCRQCNLAESAHKETTLRISYEKSFGPNGEKRLVVGLAIIPTDVIYHPGEIRPSEIHDEQP